MCHGFYGACIPVEMMTHTLNCTESCLTIHWNMITLGKEYIAFPKQITKKEKRGADLGEDFIMNVMGAIRHLETVKAQKSMFNEQWCSGPTRVNVSVKM